MSEAFHQTVADSKKLHRLAGELACDVFELLF